MIQASADCSSPACSCLTFFVHVVRAALVRAQSPVESDSDKLAPPHFGEPFSLTSSVFSFAAQQNSKARVLLRSALFKSDSELAAKRLGSGGQYIYILVSRFPESSDCSNVPHCTVWASVGTTRILVFM